MDWYYSKDAAQHGPVALEELQAKIRSGEVAPDALVWKDGMPDWAQAASVPGLVPDLPQASGAASTAPGGDAVYTPPAAPASAMYPPIPNAKPTSGLAITSLIFGILGLVTCFVFLGVVAVICGHLAMRPTDPVTGNLGGRGLAVAGLVLGYICIALLVLFVLYFIGAVATVSSY